MYIKMSMSMSTILKDKIMLKWSDFSTTQNIGTKVLTKEPKDNLVKCLVKSSMWISYKRKTELMRIIIKGGNSANLKVPMQKTTW